MTQSYESHYEVKAWVRSNAGMRKRFYKAVNQEMLAVLRPLTPFLPLNTVLILPDGDEKTMIGVFEQFEEVAKAGGILRVPNNVRVLFPSINVTIQYATSDK